MAIVGFVLLCVFGLGLSLVFLVACHQMLPKYNIGGVPNKWHDRVMVLVFAVGLFYGWRFIFECSPFSIAVTV